ncbi:hypothetical protein OAO39_02145 [Pirellulaceae bacterium]|nr:hypothetical protein [Pirellulaceae bacterium]
MSKSFKLSPTDKAQTPIFYALTQADAETRQFELNEDFFGIAQMSGPHLLSPWKWTRADQTPLYLPQGTTASGL